MGSRTRVVKINQYVRQLAQCFHTPGNASLLLSHFVQKANKTCYVGTEVLITFEAWAKLAQHWLVCAPLGIHFEPINKELMLLVTI